MFNTHHLLVVMSGGPLGRLQEKKVWCTYIYRCTCRATMDRPCHSCRLQCCTDLVQGGNFNSDIWIRTGGSPTFPSIAAAAAASSQLSTLSDLLQVGQPRPLQGGLSLRALVRSQEYCCSQIYFGFRVFWISELEFRVSNSDVLSPCAVL
jgi:hypothetical protein